MAADEVSFVSGNFNLPEGWRLTATGFQRGADRPVLIDVEIDWPHDVLPPRGGITHAVLRSVSLGDVIDRLAEGLARVNEMSGWRQEFIEGWGEGRKRLPDRQYALLAYYYDQAVRRGDPPRQVLASLMPGASMQTVDVRIAAARRRGLLGKPAPGVPGGGMTTAAVDLLGAEAELSPALHVRTRSGGRDGKH
jgi:hypothetical protein